MTDPKLAQVILENEIDEIAGQPLGRAKGGNPAIAQAVESGSVPTQSVPSGSWCSAQTNALASPFVVEKVVNRPRS